MLATEPTIPQRRLYWWKEATIIAAFYGMYSLARNQFGSARLAEGTEPVQAFHNALHVIRVERALGLYHEETVQDWFLPFRYFIQFWNTYYGTAHFIVTIVAFVWMFRQRPVDFPHWRNALAFGTALALVGFSLFPLMPPRLLNDASVYGGARIAAAEAHPHFGFVDTLADYGGPWDFDSGTMKQISNQYAAMPSLHIGWSTWCALVMWRLTRKRWARVLLLLYPAATLFCIVVTANHFWLDGVGGLVTLGAGALLGYWFNQWNDRRLLRAELRVGTPT